MSLRTTLKSLIRRSPATSLRERATELRGSLGRRASIPSPGAAAMPTPLPTPGSSEAIEAWRHACTEFDRLVFRSQAEADAEYAALRIGDTSTLWTTDWVEAALRGDFTRFSTREMAAARTKTTAELVNLLVITTRRDLRFAEAQRQTGVRDLFILAYPDGEDRAPEPEPQGDHAHVVIAAHRSAYAVWKPLGEAANEATTDHAAFAAAEAEPYRVQAEAFGELIDTHATTVGGLVALAAYLPGAVCDANCVEVEEDARRALRSICNGVLKLFGDETDADLIALQAEFLAAEAALNAAADAHADAWDRYEEPPIPVALKQWSNDWIYSSIPRPRLITLADGTALVRPYGKAEVEILRAQPCLGHFFGGTEGEPQPDGVTRVRPDPRAQARADAIVAAWDQWQELIRAARAELDLDALDAAFEAARVERDAVLQRVREATAQGLAGLAIKARIAANMAAVEDPKAHALKHHDTDDDRGLFYDLAGDVLAMTGGLPHAFRLPG